MSDVKIYTVMSDDLSPPIHDDSFCTDMVRHSDYAALAAENAGLKSFCKNAAFDADYEAELSMDTGGFTDALNDIETPATDAFLREQMAKGVDKAAHALDDCGQYNYANMLDDLATKLRAGEAV